MSFAASNGELPSDNLELRPLNDAQTMIKKHPILCTLLALTTLTGCGSPAPRFSILYDSLALEAVTQDSVKITFEVLCEEYAGRDEEPVCQEEGEVCYEVYWMAPYDEATDHGRDNLATQPIMVSQDCRRFSQTPQTLTYELPFNVPLPTTPATIVIRELPNDGTIPNIGYIFVYPETAQQQQ